MTSASPQDDKNAILACTISRDVQNFDLLIEDMEAALGNAGATWALQKLWPFSANPMLILWNLSLWRLMAKMKTTCL